MIRRRVQFHPNGDAEWTAVQDALLAAEAALALPRPLTTDADALRLTRLALTLLTKGPVTHAELAPFLGPRWRVCRPTPAAVERWGNCVTRELYSEAVSRALGARLERFSARKKEAA